MLPKGTMIHFKKGIGIGLIVLGLANLLNITKILDLLGPFQNIVWIAIAVGGYFLFISGRQGGK